MYFLERPNIKTMKAWRAAPFRHLMHFVLERCRGTVVTETPPRQSTLLQRIASYNPDGLAGQGATKPLSDPTLAQRKLHVLWCSRCKKWPCFGRKGLGGRNKAPAKLSQTEVTPYDTEVVFYGRCPRKYCKECYVDGAGGDEDQSTWVSLCRPERKRSQVTASCAKQGCRTML